MTGFEVTDVPAPDKQGCPQCSAAVRPTDRFCESCGALLSEVRRVAIPPARRAAEGPAAQCTECGNDSYFDEYCAVCGHLRAEPDRAVAEVGGVALVTDRGLLHPRNEDAAAAAIVTGRSVDRPYAIAVAVCDGVSTSQDAHTASAAASAAGVDAMLTALASAATPREAVLAGLAAAAKAAAVVGEPVAMGPSCTYTGAAVVASSAGEAHISVGNVGDGRAYWLPDSFMPARLLTVDDSVAQELLSAGAPADSDAVRRGAHTLTRWLGADAEPQPWSESSVHTFTTDCAGALVVCTDGLWNYLPDADDIARTCTDTDATAAAHQLVEYAMRAGGEDNITVVVIPIGELS